MLTVTLPDETEIGYLVDARNRRVGKKVDDVLVKGWLYQDQLEPVAELDGAGIVVSEFVYGSRAHVPDYMLKYVSGQWRTYRFVSDHLGSVRMVINAADGTVAQRIDYDEWGRAALVSGTWDFQPFGFAGGLYDPDTELVRFGARDYDPETGRWTAKDPIRFESGDTTFFGYSGSDPVNSIDPTGLMGDGGEWAFWYHWLGPGTTEEKQETINRMEVAGGIGAGIGLTGLLFGAFAPEVVAAGAAWAAPKIDRMGAAASAAYNWASSVCIKVSIDPAHHYFRTFGTKLAHIQMTIWRSGVKNSDFRWRIPLPWK